MSYKQIVGKKLLVLSVTSSVQKCPPSYKYSDNIIGSEKKPLKQ